MKKFLSIFISLSLCFSLSGCYDSKEISRIAFVIAVGFDENAYTFQIVKPSAFGGDSSDESPLLTEVISSTNVYTAMDKLNSKISEKCDYSHIKLALFSEEKLKKGIEDEVKAMLNSKDFHPTTRIAMCNKKASDFLKDMEIPLDTNPAEYYENIFKKNFTEYSPDTKLKDLQRGYNGQVIGNVIPIMDKNNLGMAVTKNYRLINKLTYDDVLTYHLLKECDFKGDYTIYGSTVINLAKKTCKYSIDLKQNPPLISVKIKLEGDVIWSEKSIDNQTLEKLIKEKLEVSMTDFLKRCSLEYKTDVFDFYKLARVNYLTNQSWEKEDWQGLYEKAEYKVTADINISRDGLTK